jgi:hypothetical protein
MKLVTFQSYRLLWLPVVIYYFYFSNLLPFYSFLPDDPINGIRGLLTLIGGFGCFFYAIGARILSRQFWQIIFTLLVFNILYEVASESIFVMMVMGVQIPITAVVQAPMVCMSGLYALHNKSIWTETE